MHTNKPWHRISVAETLKFFNTKRTGLKHDEIESRLEKYGANVLPKSKQVLTPIKIFLEQWQSPLILLLVIAAVISFSIGELLDAGVIIATALLNALVGFAQENKANRALSALKEYIQDWTTVIRDKQHEHVRVEDLVPGDIVVLEAGDKVGVDIRLLQADELNASEAVLTGESKPVHKSIGVLAEDVPLAERTNMCWRGTAITRGRGIGVVVATGIQTELGKIAKLLEDTPDEPTPLQIQIKKLGSFLVKLVGVLALFVFVIGILRGHSFSEMFIISVAVAIAAVPEGLVISMTTILAVGMQRILKKKALVRKLVTAETLGSVSVIATDKTGTLTVGEMRVVEFYTNNYEYSPSHKQTLLPSLVGDNRYPAVELLWKINFLCNNAALSNPDEDSDEWKFIGDTTEVALKHFVHNSELPFSKWKEKYKKIGELAFTSERKFMAVSVKQEEEMQLFVKGAPEVLLEQSTHFYSGARKQALNKKQKEEWKTRIQELAERGLRLLATGYCEISNDTNELNESMVKNITLVGLVAIQDPLREEVRAALETTKHAGIRTVMVTGDHPLTARAIGKELGMEVDVPGVVMTGNDLDNLSEGALRHVVTKANIFARVNPVHKIAILRALQANGEVVAMTGDGVNDAPALKGANIGVAVGSGTSIAKETADLILLNDDFTTVVVAVEQGRYIFENIKKVVLYLMSDSFSEVVLVVAALLIGIPIPIVAVQILWVNLIEDSLLNIALAFDPGEKQVMDEPPRLKNTKIFDRDMKLLTIIIGLTNNFILLSIALYMHYNNFDLVYLRSVVFAGLATNSLFYVYSCRSFRKSIIHKNPFSNPYLNIATLVGFIALVTAFYVPVFQQILHTTAISWRAWSLVLSLGVVNIILIEIGKYVFIVRKQKINKVNKKL